VGQDWDTFRVDAGWCYVVRFEEWEWYGLHMWTVIYNRIGQSRPFLGQGREQRDRVRHEASRWRVSL